MNEVLKFGIIPGIRFSYKQTSSPIARRTKGKRRITVSTDTHIRLANWSDRGELRAMQARSLRMLGAAFYEDHIIEAFISGVGTMDDTLLEDLSYFVAVLPGGQIVGCGGWSCRTPSYTSRMAANQAAGDAMKATVRSVYVEPAFARRGIGRGIMAVTEAAIAGSGFDTASLTATLQGVPLYRRLGYRTRLPVVLKLPGEEAFIAVCMEKTLAHAASPVSRAA